MYREEINVRKAVPQDLDEILSMMLELAEFEGYLDKFLVTKKELNKRLFTQEDFCVLVADLAGNAVGMLVYYHLPFAYDLSPWVYIKELFVKSDYRSMKVGRKLICALAVECKNKGTKKIRWDVLTTNISASRFYLSLGAQVESDWQLYSLDEQNISLLATL